MVDASKWPVQALALARAGLDVRVIHLVRDVRGVAYSLSKADVRRPHAVGQLDLMYHHAPANAALRWVACQSQAELLGQRGLPVTRMHYEDFVRDPRRTLQAALAALGVPTTPGDLAHVSDTDVALGPSHGLSGNPARFTEGRITLRADETSRTQMSARDRRVVTAIGLPHLLAYRHSRPQPTALEHPAMTAPTKTATRARIGPGRWSR